MRDAFPRICGGETGRGRGYGDGASRFFRPNRSGGVVRCSSGSFGIRDSSWRGTLDSIKNVVAQSHIPPAFTILPQTCSSRGRRKTFPASPEKPGVKPCIRECTGIFRYVSKGRGLCSSIHSPPRNRRKRVLALAKLLRPAATQEATPDSASAPARRNLRLFRPILSPPNLQARKDEEGESSLPIPLVSSRIHIFSILAFTCLKSTWPDTGSKARCVTALTSQRFFFGSALRGRAGTERRRPNAPTGTRRDAREF